MAPVLLAWSHQGQRVAQALFSLMWLAQNAQGYCFDFGGMKWGTSGQTAFDTRKFPARTCFI